MKKRPNRCDTCDAYDPFFCPGLDCDACGFIDEEKDIPTGNWICRINYDYTNKRIRISHYDPMISERISHIWSTDGYLFYLRGDEYPDEY